MSENGTLERLEKIELRERIAIEVQRVHGGWVLGAAENMYQWITSSKREPKVKISKKLKEAPAKVLKVLKGKRKYTKKSKFWAKKKK